MFPVRCFSCSKIIGRYEQKYKDLLETEDDKEKVLNTLGMTRYCCRRMFLGHVDIMDQLLLFPQNIENDSQKKSEPDTK